MGTLAGKSLHTPWLHTSSRASTLRGSYIVQGNYHRHIRSQKEVSMHTVTRMRTHCQARIHESSTVSRRLKIL